MIKLIAFATRATSLCLFLLYLFVTAASSSPLLQNIDSRQHLRLNGQWDVIPDPYENGYYNHRYEVKDNGYFLAETAKAPSDLIEYDFSKAQKLQVPGDWNSQDDKLFLYEGTL
jgi:beta-glucuronidase